MDRLRVGIALYNSGHYLAAHEPLEALWLEAPRGERDDCLQGLIQASAAVYKSRIGNEAGAVGLATSAINYLSKCATLDVAALVDWLQGLASDPRRSDRPEPPELRIDGDAIGVYDLTRDEITTALEAIAETESDSVLESALDYAEADLQRGRDTSPILTLVLDYIEDSTPIIRQRLREHVDRRRSRESDVEGLFE